MTPDVGGVALRAEDTGRVLMLRRAQDGESSAAGRWEFPGGHADDGESIAAAAVREWCEETGCAWPATASRCGTWASDDGTYRGYVYAVPAEADVPVAAQGEVDPRGDHFEAVRWIHPDDLEVAPARAEIVRDADRIRAALGRAQKGTRAARLGAQLAPIRQAVLHHLGDLIGRHHALGLPFAAVLDRATGLFHGTIQATYAAGARTADPTWAADATDDAVVAARTLIERRYVHGLFDAIGEGLSGEALANRLRLYARETQGAYWAGFVRAWTRRDPRVRFIWHLGAAEHCDHCVARNGRRFTADTLPCFPGDGAFGSDACAGGPNCYPGGTVVSAAVVGALRARYAGEVVELTTASGGQLTVTPNHPVATPEGFVPAHAIREGDQVLRHAGGLQNDASVDDDNNPARADEVFQLLSERSPAGPLSLWAASHDLHGDGQAVNGEIEVVGVGRVLLRDHDPECAARHRDRVLAHAAAGSTRLARGGDPAPTLWAVSTATAGGPGGPALGDGVHAAGPHETAGLRGATDSDAPRAEALRKSLPADASTLGHGEHGLSGCVGTGELVDVDPVWQSIGPVLPVDPIAIGRAAQLEPCLSQPAGQDRPADRLVLRQLLEGDTAAVSLDEVVNVRRSAFSGYVYDLQTATGWQVANGFIVANCGCWLSVRPSGAALRAGAGGAPLGTLIGVAAGTIGTAVAAGVTAATLAATASSAALFAGAAGAGAMVAGVPLAAPLTALPVTAPVTAPVTTAPTKPKSRPKSRPKAKAAAPAHHPAAQQTQPIRPPGG